MSRDQRQPLITGPVRGRSALASRSLWSSQRTAVARFSDPGDAAFADACFGSPMTLGCASGSTGLSQLTTSAGQYRRGSRQTTHLAYASSRLDGMTTPDRRPASERIADELRQAISAGQLAPGAKLPSERELADQY